jgi:hypothetical protein
MLRNADPWPIFTLSQSDGEFFQTETKLPAVQRHSRRLSTNYHWWKKHQTRSLGNPTRIFANERLTSEIIVKSFLVIAGLLGLLVGTGIRNLPQPLPQGAAKREIKRAAPSVREQETSSEGQPLLSWKIRDDLGSAELLALPAGAARLANTALWALSATNEELAAHWRLLTTSGYLDYRELQQIMAIWVSRDPDAAFAQIRGGKWEATFFLALAKDDPKKAISLIDPKKSYYQYTLGVIAESDPEFVLGLHDEAWNLANNVGKGVAAGLFKKDPAAALDFLEPYRLFMPNNEAELLLRWATSDPLQALSWGLKTQSWGTGRIMPLLVKDHSDLLISEFSNLPTGRFKNQSLVQLAGLLASLDPQKALKLAEAQAGRGKMDLLSSIGTEIVTNDAPMAKEILGRIFEVNASENDHGRPMELPPWTSTLINSEPAAILEMAGAQSPELESKIIRDWSDENPAMARAYFESGQASAIQLSTYQAILDGQ